MSWQDIIKNERDIKTFIGILEKEVDTFLNNNIFDESDYTEEKVKQLQEDVDSGKVLAGIGLFLNVKWTLDEAIQSEGVSLYVRVEEKDGTYMCSFEFNLDGEIVPARFTFVVAKNDMGEFEIINHHSSIFA